MAEQGHLLRGRTAPLYPDGTGITLAADQMLRLMVPQEQETVHSAINKASFNVMQTISLSGKEIPVALLSIGIQHAIEGFIAAAMLHSKVGNYSVQGTPEPEHLQAMAEIANAYRACADQLDAALEKVSPKKGPPYA